MSAQRMKEVSATIRSRQVNISERSLHWRISGRVCYANAAIIAVGKFKPLAYAKRTSEGCPTSIASQTAMDNTNVPTFRPRNNTKEAAIPLCELAPLQSRLATPVRFGLGGRRVFHQATSRCSKTDSGTVRRISGICQFAILLGSNLRLRTSAVVLATPGMCSTISGAYSQLPN